MGYGRSYDEVTDPVSVVSSHVKYLQLKGVHVVIPLAVIYKRGHFCMVRSTEITAALRIAAHYIDHCHGIRPGNIPTWSMQSGGAMALLLAGVGRQRIKILGRWRLDAII